MKKYILLLQVLLFSAACFAQQNKDDKPKPPPDPRADRNMFGHWIPRGLTKSTEDLTPGYVMFVPANSASVYLINRKGEVVHEWKGNYPVMGAYLNNDGSLIQNAHDPDFPVFAGGGESGRLQKITWDGKIVWDFEYADEKQHAHHDFTIMPNGNILAIAWEAKTYNEALAAGRKAELIPKAGVWPDKIVEIQPQGERGGKVVWEWHIWDHMIQDNDPKKPNYGKPVDHPELLDINVGEPLPNLSADSVATLKKIGRIMWRNQTHENLGSDLYHFNAVKYNPELDQIAFSSPHLDEIFIIDHSTTTAEAASHKGGRYGKGGDFLYRWGNPQNYQRGDSTSKQLFGQHDVRWIEKGTPGEGHLTVYNNNVPGPNKMNYSAIYEIAPPIDAKGNYRLEKGKAFGPEKPVWVYVAKDTVSFWGSFVSGAHRMKNGNTFINEGPRGRFLEVTPKGDVVWEYLNPYRGDIRQTNGDPVPAMPLTYFQFRSTFIPATHPGLANRKLEPLNPQPKPFVLPPRQQASR